MNIEAEVKIRPYTPADYPQVESCLKASQLFYASMDSQNRLDRANALSPGCILVAELSGQVIGNVIVQDLYGPVFFRLAVSPEHRGQGIGQQLNAAAKDRAKSQGFTQAHILVAEAETELQDLYRSWGWQPGNLYRWMYTDL